MKKVVHFAPESVVHIRPESVVHFRPESVVHFHRNTQFRLINLIIVRCHFDSK